NTLPSCIHLSSHYRYNILIFYFPIFKSRIIVTCSNLSFNE
ncbi:unnamed protein product, partial [Linum tenue]